MMPSRAYGAGTLRDMNIDGQASFDAVSAEFNGAAAALMQRAGAMKPGRDRDALVAQMQAEMAKVQGIFGRLGRGGVPGDEYIAGLEEVRAATGRMQALDRAPEKRGIFRRR